MEILKPLLLQPYQRNRRNRGWEILSSVTRQIPKAQHPTHWRRLQCTPGTKRWFQTCTTTNRNGMMLKDFLLENNLLCFNTKFQKWIGQLWTHDSPNVTKAQLDYARTASETAGHPTHSLLSAQITVQSVQSSDYVLEPTRRKRPTQSDMIGLTWETTMKFSTISLLVSKTDFLPYKTQKRKPLQPTDTRTSKLPAKNPQ